LSRKQAKLIQRLLIRLYPGVKKKLLMDLLWGATAFPCCDYETLRKQIVLAHKKGKGTVYGALAWADEEMCSAHDEYMRKMKEENVRAETAEV